MCCRILAGLSLQDCPLDEGQCFCKPLLFIQLTSIKSKYRSFSFSSKTYLHKPIWCKTLSNRKVPKGFKPPAFSKPLELVGSQDLPTFRAALDFTALGGETGGGSEDTAVLEGDLPDLEVIYSSHLDCRQGQFWMAMAWLLGLLALDILGQVSVGEQQLCHL